MQSPPKLMSHLPIQNLCRRHTGGSCDPTWGSHGLTQVQNGPRKVYIDGKPIIRASKRARSQPATPQWDQDMPPATTAVSGYPRGGGKWTVKKSGGGYDPPPKRLEYHWESEPRTLTKVEQKSCTTKHCNPPPPNSGAPAPL